MIGVLQFFWPYAEGESASDSARRKIELDAEIAVIRNTKWETDSDVALEEARNLVSAELDRRRSAETKASVYLAIVSALIPVISTFLTLPENPSGELSTFSGINIVLFLLGTLYLVGGGIWAFHTLQVGNFVRVDSAEMVEYWSGKEPKSKLVSELLISNLINRDVVNKKTTYVKLAHQFLVRAFVVFSVIVAVQVLWTPIKVLYEHFFAI